MAKEEKKELELVDTVEDMTSPDYKKRFIAEYTQLCIRINKLKRFIGKIAYAKYAGVEEPKHDCPIYLLESQLVVMGLYEQALKVRAKEYESIELPKILEE